VHFACHGYSDLDSPSNSHLLVQDHGNQPLTVLDITRLDLREAELAFLSACHTARTRATLPDEAIHISSAFQLAGYPHVIGTLWSINDSVAVRVADRFYDHLTIDNIRNVAKSAYALHHAVQELRAKTLDAPLFWAAYIHGGI
jgi:CHAT domain-containing protein